MRREERVTVQGPVKEQQPDGMSHRGGGTLPPDVKSGPGGHQVCGGEIQGFGGLGAERRPGPPPSPRSLVPWFKVLLPWLAQKPLEDLLRKSEAAPGVEWRTAQYSATDWYRSVKRGVQYVLGRLGVDRRVVKRISFHMRLLLCQKARADLDLAERSPARPLGGCGASAISFGDSGARDAKLLTSLNFGDRGARDAKLLTSLNVSKISQETVEY